MQLKSTFNEQDLQAYRVADPDTARLPAGQMNMIDCVTHIHNEGGRYGQGEIKAEYKITPDKWFFDCHFPGDPVMPGCLGLDALWQLSGFYLSWAGYRGRGRALGCGSVKFSGEILPETGVVSYQVDVRRTLKKGMTMIVSDGYVYADGVQIYAAEKLRVALLPRNEGMQS
ncbi:MAG: bifunctional 3-hydroxydecanoyl-ACP dehydratase/trans-2-decenoyl-ACP isomerase [Pseudomonadales bacterium]|uniref:3-hydroxydecanoyl-(Acyl carrier protein) dehydratase n=1 Tax=Oleiphilus messinensis TaxID=141451 RepID=A0A1Y0IB50_9GAMM|nr:bifunctional 3-hydroxydecanoyl-ACP dehydratase/trans-2-decenoyl-ACP isomerase [Oleiphilus messinensis]ARU56644.1 3-hydroxydecanoyl-(acyl carrier protein) dehydratase [Oleiphilus messinensis]MCG8614042.1 bifunctional 3-hydroxydecanoyl-ACP dehydratase/trans-2-decenoyl-ACP isomerase [Pseudomonadales bacterium]